MLSDVVDTADATITGTMFPVIQVQMTCPKVFLERSGATHGQRLLQPCAQHAKILALSALIGNNHQFEKSVF